jgi:pSer/pThr/pTyr-binding forkhead associated (FHA) protein
MNDQIPTSSQPLPENVFLAIDQHLIPLQKITFYLGRHTNNDLVITDPSVSRHHAKIEFTDDTFVLLDLDSTFGTFVNQERIKKQILKNGDTISLANTPLLFIDRSAAVIRRGDDVTGVLREDL